MHVHAETFLQFESFLNDCDAAAPEYEKLLALAYAIYFGPAHRNMNRWERGIHPPTK